MTEDAHVPSKRMREFLRSFVATVDPVHLSSRVQRAWKEQGATRTAFRLALSPDPLDRDEAATDFLHLLLERELRRATTPSQAKGLAGELLASPEIRDGLRVTMHLGAIHPISFLKATRLHYVELTLVALLEMKKLYPGLGLGSRTTEWNGPGAPTDLELAQMWAILHSWGHLFGTFATERGLLFMLARDTILDRTLKRDTLPALRDPVQAVLQTGNLYHAYYGIGAWRASTELQGRKQRIACEALRLFFAHREKPAPSMLYRAYKRARQLAYHRLHSYERLGATCDFSKDSEAVRWIMAEPELVLDQEIKTSFADLLDYFDSFQSEEIFTTPHAASLVLTHLRAFKRWWRNHRPTRPPSELLHDLAREPDDWPEDGFSQLDHALRMRLPAPSDRWATEVREWQKCGTWEHGNFLLSPAPRASGLICDVYAERNVTPAQEAALYYAVACRLAAHCSLTFSGTLQSSPALWRSVALLGLRLLARLLKPELVATLEPTEGSAGHAPHAMILDSVAAVRDELGRLLATLTDAKRKDEMNALRDALPTMDDGALWLVFLGVVRFTDSDTGQQRREVDGLWAKILPTCIEWTFLEQKAYRQSGAHGQLDSLVRDLRFPITASERSETNSGKATRCVCSWPC